MSESWPGGRERVQMTVELNVPIEMRDGVVTRADIYLPREPGRHPVVLTRTPYDKSNTANSYLGLRPLRAISRGYAVVIQDVRGRFASEGEFDPLRNEIDDGYDSVEWCAAQRWAEPRVGMYGGSYVGATQWLAAAAGAPHLACIAPFVTASNFYEGWFYRGGALQLSFAEAWCLNFFSPTALVRQGRPGEAERIMDIRDGMDRTAFNFFPVSEIPHFRGNADFFYDWVAHTEQDEYWEEINLENYRQKIKVPSLNIGGWYDIFLQGTIDNFSEMLKLGGNEESRAQRLLIGPWMHSGRGPWLDRLSGEIDFGHRASHLTMDLEGMILDWYDRWMKGAPAKKHESPIRIFVMGDNVWRDEDEWPLARTKYIDYYIHSGGSANSSAGDGSLDEAAPADRESPDRFVYDPLDPVPTCGGSICCDPTFNPAGPYDQAAVEGRRDVLVYTTPRLKGPVEVTGPVELTLFAATSAADTDFTGKLVDAWPCGFLQPVAEGIIRARYRDSRKSPKPIEPGKVYRYAIDLWSTSNVFKKDHQIRVEISSSNFPHFDRNMNTAKHPSQESRPSVAVQHVYHDSTHPSHLTLPIIPR